MIKINYLYGGRCQKEFFNFSSDIYVCSTYIPPSNSSREKNVQTDHFRILNENITTYRNLGKVIFCGDFSSRVAILPDFISEKEQNPEFDIHYESTQSTIPRISKDKNINPYGRNLLRPVFHTVLGLPMVERVVIV